MRLKMARKRANMTIAAASVHSGIGVSSVSEFENGKREPRMSQMSSLATVYGCPLSFFFSESEPRLPDVVLWRMEPERRVAESVESRFLQLCTQYQNLETWCNAANAEELPITAGSPGKFSYSQAQALATRVRSELRMGDHPGPGLRKVLEETRGIKVFYLKFRPTGCAACTYSSKFGPAILLNSNNAPWRRSYDLAHELFHLLTWKVFRGDQEGSIFRPDIYEEKLADSFASHLLLPPEALQNSLNAVEKEGKVALSDIADIAREYDVSVDALVWRIHFLNRWQDSEKTRQLIDRIKGEAGPRRQWSVDESPALPERYVALAIKAVNNGLISTAKFAEYLEIERDEAMKFITQSAVNHDPITIIPS
jgi:Zn-dependent peptidase ImmA (M78 family)/transcriptional regulator with XRE-family HTH domain